MDGQQRGSEKEEERRQRHDNDVLFIKESVVRKLLSWNDCVDAMEQALVAMSSASSSAALPPSSSSSSSQEASTDDKPFASQTPRTFTMAGGGGGGTAGGVLLTMPGYTANYTLRTVTGSETRHSTLACKLVTSFAGNSQLTPPLPTILATILLFDSASGKLKAIVDGTDITAWRTAAVSVVATKYLFRPAQRTTATLAIVGTGTQGRIHALAMLNYFPGVFTRINLWNRTRERADLLRVELNEAFPEVEIVVAGTSAECVIGADCIVTATSSSQPLFALKDLKEGDVHINAIGAGQHHHSELAMDVYQSAAGVFIESSVGIQTELKGIREFISGEIGEIIVGRKQLDAASDGGSGGGMSNGRKSVFQSMGNAIEDGVMANLIYQKFIKL